MRAQESGWHAEKEKERESSTGYIHLNHISLSIFSTETVSLCVTIMCMSAYLVLLYLVAVTFVSWCSNDAIVRPASVIANPPTDLDIDVSCTSVRDLLRFASQCCLVMLPDSLYYVGIAVCDELRRSCVSVLARVTSARVHRTRWCEFSTYACVCSFSSDWTFRLHPCRGDDLAEVARMSRRFAEGQLMNC